MSGCGASEGRRIKFLLENPEVSLSFHATKGIFSNSSTVGRSSGLYLSAAFFKTTSVMIAATHTHTGPQTHQGMVGLTDLFRVADPHA